MAEKEYVPPSKKRKLSLSLRNRFKAGTHDELEDLSKVKMTKNTIQSTRWAMKNFQDWFIGYNDRNPDNQCPDEILLPCCSVDTLSKWLCVYVAKARSQTGEAYPPTTVHSLLSGILRHTKSVNPMYPNFFDKNDPLFSTFNVTLDNLFKNLRSEGVGATSKHTQGISAQEENLLWTSGV